MKSAFTPVAAFRPRKRCTKTIVQRLEAVGSPRAEILIVLNEPPLGNWGMRGGIPSSELDLGFNLNV